MRAPHPILGSLLLAALLAACGPGAAPAARPGSGAPAATGGATASASAPAQQPASAQQPPRTVQVGVATSGGTTLPALVIEQQGLDQKHGVKIEWTRLDQAAVQKAFALRQFDVSFAQVALDLVRQRAKGDRVQSVYTGIMSNVYVVVKREAPYQTLADLKGKKIGVYSLTSGSTAGLIKIVQDRWGLDFQRDFEVIVAAPPALLQLLQKGDIEAMVNVDPNVLRVLEGGGYRQIMDIDDDWQALSGSRLLVTTIAVWDDWARQNPEVVRNLVRTYRAAVDYIQQTPEVYNTTGFIKDSGLDESPTVLKLFQERFNKLYTAEWNQALIDSNNKVFEQAIKMGNLDAIPPDWYTFEYAR